MTRNVLLFLGTFVAGALIALVARSAMFEPHAEHANPATSGGEYASMVTNTLAPANAASSDADPHATHHSSAPASTSDQPVNTVCAICGMDVDPSLPTAEYQGKTIGFGCRMCPSKFKADPDRWGPYYLRNEVVQK